MATMIIAGTRYDMPVWLKARLLEVQPAEDEANVLIVESGSEVGKTYRVRHDGQQSTFCPCKATIEACAHRIAADRFLANAAAVGADIAQDLQAHIDDSDLPAIADEIEGKLAREAWAILETEKRHEEAMKKTLAAYLTAQSIAADRHGEKRAEVEVVRGVVRDIERFGCRYGKDGNEYRVFTDEERAKAPLNGNQGFSLMR